MKMKHIGQNSKFIVVFFLFVLVLTIGACKPKAENEKFTSDPISSIAHGSIIGTDGNVITPSENFILGVQEYYITTILKNLKQSDSKIGVEIRRKIDRLVTNNVLANAIFIDWLLKKEQPDEIINIAVANNVLRWYYISNIQNDPILPTEDEPWAHGIESEIAAKLEFEGLEIFVKVPANAVYRQKCIDAGVPIPDELFGDKWERIGFFEHGSPIQSELSFYGSHEPLGFCLARYNYDDDKSGTYMLICLGTQSNNACFFEDDDITFSGDKNIGVLDVGFVAPPCTLCHAGENPFIVHPGDTVFMEAAKLKRDFLDDPLVTPPNLMGTGWYKPMFNSFITSEFTVGIPQNPEPGSIDQLKLDHLDFLTSEKKCTACHSKSGGGGRFPKESEFNAYYCGSVLSKVLNGSGDLSPTMPLFDLANVHKYANQINNLNEWCGFEAISGTPLKADK